MSIIQSKLDNEAIDIGRADWVPMSNLVSLKSKNLGEVQRHLSTRNFPHELSQQRSSPISFRHHHAILGSLSFSYTDYGDATSPLRIKAPSMEDIFTVVLTLSGSAQITCGGRSTFCQRGDLTVLEPGGTFTMVMSGDHRPLYVTARRQVLERCLADVLGYQLPRPLQLDERQFLTPEASGHIARVMLSICADLNSRNPTFLLPNIRERVEELMLCTIVTQLSHNYSHAIGGTSASDAPFYIKRALRFIGANLSDDIVMDDIVAAAGVSARSVYAGFRRYLNDTPTGFVKAQRLQVARSELVKSDGKFVTEIAMACGFTQASKFASDYKKRFGITPSQTRSDHRDVDGGLAGLRCASRDGKRSN